MSTVALIFDKESQDKINDIKKILSFNNKSELLINHISIAGYDIDNSNILKEKVNNFFRDFKPIEINIIGVNIFNEDKNTIFLEIELTKELYKIYNDFINYAYDIKEKLKIFYINDWVPHCTIAINISENDLNEGYKLLKETLKFPIKVNINRVDII